MDIKSDHSTFLVKKSIPYGLRIKAKRITSYIKAQTTRNSIEDHKGIIKTRVKQAAHELTVEKSGSTDITRLLEYR